MNSSTPYIIRAINEWILDNGCTPYLVLDATEEGVSVPQDYVKDGQIVLNISAAAVRDLVIEEGHIMFSGRFQGRVHEVYAPIRAVLGIVAKENGEGVWFPRDGDDAPDPSPPKSKGKPQPKGKPHLKLVK